MKKETSVKNGLKRAALVACTMIMGLFASCSDDDGGTASNPANGKNVKLTITIDGAVDSDYISFVAVGSAASSPSETTVWKVNGVTLTNEQGVSLGENDFTGPTKTYVIESVTGLSAVSVGMQFLTAPERSYTFSYKAEVNGQVVKEENGVQVTSNNDYTHDYSY